MGTKLIIDNSKVIVNKGGRYGIVGPNGCGKTTILNYIRDNLPPYVQQYMVNQHIVFEESENVLDFMLKADINVYLTNQKVSELEAIDEMNDEELDEYNKLTESEAYAYYDKYLALSKRILNGLGITDYEILVKTYSGGWRMRLSIAKALISNPEVLIMDEPTNHLDLEAVIWLSHYLSEYKNTLLITSHNVDFVNQFSNTILYIGSPDFKAPKLYTIRGDYDRLQQTLVDISKSATTAYEKLEAEVAKMRKKSKPKSEIEEYVSKANIPRPPRPYDVIIRFPEISRIQHSNVIRLNDVSFSFNTIDDNKPKQIFDNIDFSINLDSRFVIVGLNGVGKTTLFKLCLKHLEPDSGEVLVDSRIKIGYYNQQVIEGLPLHMTPIEYLQSLDHTLDLTKCRAILGRIGLRRVETADPCVIPIENLSGGQKARVSFCALQILEPHIILLDEPTNHLDIESIQGLIQGINEYQGGIVMITHDVHLIASVENTTIFEIANKKINRFDCDIDDYVEKIIGDE